MKNPPAQLGGLQVAIPRPERHAAIFAGGASQAGEKCLIHCGISGNVGARKKKTADTKITKITKVTKNQRVRVKEEKATGKAGGPAYRRSAGGALARE
jgi:hypothetical protein